MKYIVELEKGVFLAPWEGDPGRTLHRTNAKKFNTRIGALRATNFACAYREFLDVQIHEIPDNPPRPGEEQIKQ